MVWRDVWRMDWRIDGRTDWRMDWRMDRRTDWKLHNIKRVKKKNLIVEREVYKILYWIYSLRHSISLINDYSDNSQISYERMIFIYLSN